MSLEAKPTVWITRLATTILKQEFNPNDYDNDDKKENARVSRKLVYILSFFRVYDTIPYRKFLFKYLDLDNHNDDNNADNTMNNAENNTNNNIIGLEYFIKPVLCGTTLQNIIDNSHIKNIFTELFAKLCNKNQQELSKELNNYMGHNFDDYAWPLLVKDLNSNLTWIKFPDYNRATIKKYKFPFLQDDDNDNMDNNAEKICNKLFDYKLVDETAYKYTVDYDKIISKCKMEIPIFNGSWILTSNLSFDLRYHYRQYSHGINIFDRTIEKRKDQMDEQIYSIVFDDKSRNIIRGNQDLIIPVNEYLTKFKYNAEPCHLNNSGLPLNHIYLPLIINHYIVIKWVKSKHILSIFLFDKGCITLYLIVFNAGSSTNVSVQVTSYDGEFFLNSCANINKTVLPFKEIDNYGNIFDYFKYSFEYDLLIVCGYNGSVIFKNNKQIIRFAASSESWTHVIGSFRFIDEYLIYYYAYITTEGENKSILIIYDCNLLVKIDETITIWIGNNNISKMDSANTSENYIKDNVAVISGEVFRLFLDRAYDLIVIDDFLSWKIYKYLH